MYSGSILQRGYGTGGPFRGLANGILPFLPKISIIVAKTALGVASDKIAGIPLSRSFKQRELATGKRLLASTLRNKNENIDP